MPTPSKFTEERREKIIQALSVGASRNTAAAIAGVDEAQVRRWIAKGKDADDGTRFRKFYEDVIAAEASPRLRALGIVYRELPDNPTLAWKYVERKEPGYAPPMLDAPTSTGPLVVHLSLHDGAMPAALGEGEIVEGEIVDESDDEPGTGTS